MIERLLDWLARRRWLIPDEVLRGIGRVKYTRWDGIGVLEDKRLDPRHIAVVGVPVRKNSYVPRGQLLSLKDPVDGITRIFVNPEDGIRIFGGITMWWDAPWGAL